MHGFCLRTSLLAALVLVTPNAHAGPPKKRAGARGQAPTSMTVERARELLRLPKGSVSIGSTSWGELVRAHAMRPRGHNWRFFGHIRERKTYFATDDMAGLIERTAKRLKDEFKVGPLQLGNIGYSNGGKIPWSVSHRAGRDADLAMFTLDRRGRSVRLHDFVEFQHNGRSKDRRYRFDTRRNLALMQALLADDEVQVQWVFVASWLKESLLKRARRDKLPAAFIAKLEAVLRQPSDAAPHNDHFHVRIYCSVEDRLHGCVDREPFHPWVDRGDDAYAKRVQELVQVLALPDASIRAKAARKLGRLQAVTAIPAVVAALGDPKSEVREAALWSLRAIGSPKALEGVVSAMRTTADAGWARELLSLAGHLAPKRAVDVALELLEQPRRFLDAALKASTLGPLHEAAARILAGDGRKRAARALLPLLESDDRDVRKSAHEALERITNQRIRGSITSRSERRRARVVKRWKSFFEEHGDSSWWQWLRLGFEQRGYRFKHRMMSWDSIPTLIRAVGNRDENVSHNAVRVLGEITGHHVDPRWRSRRGNLRHWRAWWRTNGRRSSKR